MDESGAKTTAADAVPVQLHDLHVQRSTGSSRRGTLGRSVGCQSIQRGNLKDTKKGFVK